MENISAAVFETMVNSFTDVDEFMNFAITWGLLESPTVRLRLFQLRNPEYSCAFVNEQLDNILPSLGGPTTQTGQRFRVGSGVCKRARRGGRVDQGDNVRQRNGGIRTNVCRGWREESYGTDKGRG